MAAYNVYNALEVTESLALSAFAEVMAKINSEDSVRMSVIRDGINCNLNALDDYIDKTEGYNQLDSVAGEFGLLTKAHLVRFFWSVVDAELCKYALAHYAKLQEMSA